MEDDLIFFLNVRQPKFFEYGRRPNFSVKERQPQKQYIKMMQAETFKIKTMVVAPLQVT